MTKEQMYLLGFKTALDRLEEEIKRIEACGCIDIHTFDVADIIKELRSRVEWN